MKTMFLAAATALTLSAGVANAESEGGPIANSQFTENPSYLAQAPGQSAPSVATAQTGQVTHVYATQSGRGTWLFPSQDGGGANS